jgi:YbbR domain-containing protein
MRLHFGTLLLSAIIAMVLWGMAHGTSSIERSVDIPVVFYDVPEEVVITDRSVDAVNVRVLGSRAALRNVSPTKLDYRIDLSGAKPGPAVFELDESRIDPPRGARIVSRSPASIEVMLERRGRKALIVRPDLEGVPAEGFVVASVTVDPPRVWLTGARSDVMRLTDVVTEVIDVTGATGSLEREVGLSLGSQHVWREEDGPVSVTVEVQAAVPEPGEGEHEARTSAAPSEEDA